MPSVMSWTIRAPSPRVGPIGGSRADGPLLTPTVAGAPLPPPPLPAVTRSAHGLTTVCWR